MQNHYEIPSIKMIKKLRYEGDSKLENERIKATAFLYDFIDIINSGEYIKINDYPDQNIEYINAYWSREVIKIVKAHEKDKKKNKISKMVLGEVLERFIAVIDNYKYDFPLGCNNIYTYAFAFLNYYNDKSDYLFYRDRLLKHYYDNRYILENYTITTWGYHSFMHANADDYIPSGLFEIYININNYITDFGKSFIDEITHIITSKLDRIYNEENINFIYYFGDVNYFEYKVNVTFNDCFTDNPASVYSFYETDSWPIYRIYNVEFDFSKIKRFIKECENVLRSNMNLPAIGEGWVSEQVLYNIISEFFDDEYVEQHSSPLFLGRQHYDVYFPQHKIALEYQGDQHFKPIEYFGGKEGLEFTKQRDERKKMISAQNNVTLIEVLPNYDVVELIKKIIVLINKPQYYSKINQEKLDRKLLDEHDKQSEKIKLIKAVRANSKRNSINEKVAEKERLKNRKYKEEADICFFRYALYINHCIKKYKYLELSVYDVERIIEEAKTEIKRIWKDEYSIYNFSQLQTDYPKMLPHSRIDDDNCKGISIIMSASCSFHQKHKQYEKALEEAMFCINNNINVWSFELDKEKILSIMNNEKN